MTMLKINEVFFNSSSETFQVGYMSLCLENLQDLAGGCVDEVQDDEYGDRAYINENRQLVISTINSGEAYCDIDDLMKAIGSDFYSD